MCDYSLERQDSRQARAGDRLVTSTFSGTSSRGFSASGEPDVAVCLRPGTELAFDAPIALEGLFGFLLESAHKISRTARFRLVNTHNHLLHHDALELGSGEIVLLAHLEPGQCATVLQLPAAADAARLPDATPRQVHRAALAI